MRQPLSRRIRQLARRHPLQQVNQRVLRHRLLIKLLRSHQPHSLLVYPSKHRHRLPRVIQSVLQHQPR